VVLPPTYQKEKKQGIDPAFGFCCRRDYGTIRRKIDFAAFHAPLPDARRAFLPCFWRMLCARGETPLTARMHPQIMIPIAIRIERFSTMPPLKAIRQEGHPLELRANPSCWS